MGTDADEIVKDYMLTYYNFYGIEPGTEQYRQIAERNIEATLANTFGIQSVNDESIDLQACAEDYLKNIGLNAEEITALKGSLSKEY